MWVVLYIQAYLKYLMQPLVAVCEKIPLDQYRNIPDCEPK
jgi:hypothetical protein